MNPSVTEVLNKYQDFSNIPENILEAAATRGSSVHMFCAAYVTGLWSPIESGCEGYCHSFRVWFDKYVESVTLIETRLYSEKHGYHGQLDFFGKLKGDKVPRIIDWKTPVVENKKWLIQVSAYRNLLLENGYKVGEAGFLRLRKDGGIAIYTGCNDTTRDFIAFLNALSAHKYILGE